MSQDVPGARRPSPRPRPSDPAPRDDQAADGSALRRPPAREVAPGGQERVTVAELLRRQRVGGSPPEPARPAPAGRPEPPARAPEPPERSRSAPPPPRPADGETQRIRKLPPAGPADEPPVADYSDLQQDRVPPPPPVRAAREAGVPTHAGAAEDGWSVPEQNRAVRDWEGGDRPDAEHPTRRRAAMLARLLVALVALAVFTVTGLAWGGLRYVDSTLRQVDALDEGAESVQQPEAQLGDENFLLIGSDTRAGESGDIGAGTADTVEGARSDTTMIAHIPADRSRMVIVSFPRDLDVDLPECNRWDNAAAAYTDEVIPAQFGVKLNSAYAEGGPQCVTKVAQQLSGLNVNHFLGVDFSGFKSMVDAVDGVEVCSEQPLQDSILGTVLPVAGPQVINGEQALNYVRARHVEGDPTSDYGRIQRQQRFLASLLRKSLSSDTLFNLGKLKKLVDAVSASTFGDNVGAQDLADIARSLQGLEPGRVSFITAPTTGGANAAGNEELLSTENAELFDAIRNGTPLPGEAAQAAPPSAPAAGDEPAPPVPDAPEAPDTPDAQLVALDPASVRMEILNATGTGGLAAEVGAELEQYSFRAESTGNAPGPVQGNVVRYAPAEQAQAETLAAAVPGTRLEPVDGLGEVVQLVLGTDVRGSLVAPPAPGTGLADTLGPVEPTPPALPSDLAVVNGGDAGCT